MIQPNKGIVFIKTDGIKTEDNGILISEQWEDRLPTGTVVSIGKDVTFCDIGDRVFFERYTSIDTPFGDDIRACREDAIISKFEEGDEIL